MLQSLEPRSLFASIGLDATFGNDGTTVLPVQMATEEMVTNAAGQTYLLGQTTTYERRQPRYQVVLERLNAAGAVDTTFSDDGWLPATEVRDVSISDAFQSSAIASTVSGNRTIAGGTDWVVVVNANGVRQNAVEQNLLATYGNIQARSIQSIAFNSAGRMLIGGWFKFENSARLRLGVARYLTDGRIDATFGDFGMVAIQNDAGVIESEFGILDQLLRVEQLAVAGNGAVGALVATTAMYNAYPDGELATAGGVELAVLREEGGNQIQTWSINNPGGAEGTDLREVPGNRFAVLGNVGGRQAWAIVGSDGAVIEENREVDAHQHYLRLTGRGAIVEMPGANVIGDLTDQNWASSDLASNGRRFAIDAQDRVLVSGEAGGRGKARFAVQRFDGSPPETNDAPGTARVLNRGATLSIRGTDGADRIRIRFHAGSLRLWLNDRSVQVFARSSFQSVSIDAGAGNDAVDIRSGDLLDPFYVSGGAGDDRIFTSWFDGEVNGGDGNDVIHTLHRHDEGTTRGGAGNDLIVSNSADGGTGDDILRGARPNARLIGGDGNDRLYSLVAHGRTDLIGGAGDDTLVGGASEIGIWGDDGDDVAYLYPGQAFDGLGVETLRRLARR